MDNLDKLLEALDHPEKFSAEEIEKLLSDPEIRDLYEMLATTRSTSFTDSYLDEKAVEREWEKLSTQRRESVAHASKWRFFRKLAFNRKVAVIITIIVISCSVVAVGVSLGLKFSGKSEVVNQEVDTPLNETLLVSTDEVQPLLNDTTILFEEEKLEVILDKIAPYYDVKIEHKASQTKDVRLFLRWSSTMPLEDLIDHLNSFDRINLTLNDSTLIIY